RPGRHRRGVCHARRPAGGGRRRAPGLPPAGRCAVRGMPQSAQGANEPVSPAGRPLPPVAAQVDAGLARLDAELDWLLALTPLGTDALWQDFDARGRTQVAPLRYAEPALDLEALRARLRALPVERVESPLLAGLLGEKQR